MTKKLWIIFIWAFIFRIILSFVYWHPDVNSNADWGIRFFQYGPSKFFAPESNVWSFTWPNQPPGTIYIFAGIRKLFEYVFAFFWWINVNVSIFPSGIMTFFETNLYPALLKLPSILADMGIAYLLYKLTKKSLAPVLWLVNPVIWYNSSLWGQTDATVSFFALLAFYFLFEKRIILAVLAMAICLYIKISLFIFVPVFLIVLVRQKYDLSKYVSALVVSLIVVGALTLPFSKGEPFSWLINLYQTKVLGQQLQIITANAFNIWTTIAGINEQPQSLPFLALTYQYWGYILFAVFYFPLLFISWKKQDVKSISIALALTAFSSWMFLTNMHERYLYPLFPYLTILVATGSVGQFVYWVIGGIGLLNMYNFWWYPEIDLIVGFLSFGDRLMPRIFGLINLGFFAYLYSRFFRLLRFTKI